MSAHLDLILTVSCIADGPPYPSAGLSFVNGMASSMTGPMGSNWPYEAYQKYASLHRSPSTMHVTNENCFLSYPDTQFTAADAQKRVWAENYSRLQGIKAK